jgi:hypothetical protein
MEGKMKPIFAVHGLVTMLCFNPTLAQISESKLTASDGAAEDHFGASVSISGEYALIGAWHDGDSGSSSGSAYIFKRDGVIWTEEARLTASDGANGDFFGTSVSLSGDYAIVGEKLSAHTVIFAVFTCGIDSM